MVVRVLASVDPVWPVNGDEAGGLGLPGWAWVAIAVGVAVVAGGVVSYFAWRDRRRHTPEHRAFRALARRLRLRGRGRALVEELARAAQVPPVALLVSEHAFRTAATGRSDDDSVRAVRERVFADL